MRISLGDERTVKGGWRPRAGGLEEWQPSAEEEQEGRGELRSR